MKNYAEEFKKLFEEECRHWAPGDQRRYLNIVNDPEEVDEEEMQSAREFVQQVNARIRKLAG